MQGLSSTGNWQPTTDATQGNPSKKNISLAIN
jgi:hypothetical protein